MKPLTVPFFLLALFCLPTHFSKAQEIQPLNPLQMGAAKRNFCVEDLERRVRQYKLETADHLQSAEALSEDSGPNVPLKSFLNFERTPDCMSVLILSSAPFDDVLIARASAAKTSFQQNGASAGSGSTTNLVSKGRSAQILGTAAEYGALTESVSGQTVTIQGQAGGIFEVLEKNGILINCDGISRFEERCIPTASLDFLNRFSYSVAFDASSKSQTLTGTPVTTTSSTTQQVIFTPTTHTISSVTGKFVIMRGASATPAEILKALKNSANTSVGGPEGDKVKAAGIALAGSVASLAPALKKWKEDTFAAIAQSTPETAAAVWKASGSRLLGILCPSTNSPGCDHGVPNAVVLYALHVNGYKLAVNDFLQGLGKKPVLTFEYDDNLPASQPSNSTFRLVYGQDLGNWTLTLNAAAAIYNKTPSTAVPDSSRLRDIQVAAEAAFNFGKGKGPAFFGNSTASGAYYFQDQTSPAILNVTPGQPVTGVTFVGLPSTATQVYAEKGKISILQGRFTFSPGKSSISIPLSVTWSNRTELVTNSRSIWRGQVGVNYTFDSLFGALGK